MVKKLAYKIGAIFLLGVFCLYITPRDFVHHFIGHEDTIDEQCSAISTDGPVFSAQHQHCEWLHWAVEAYLEPHTTCLPSASHQFEVLLAGLPANSFTYPAYYFSLRAPPQA
jgi:hypothetical protein